jgi:hypothetical protein
MAVALLPLNTRAIEFSEVARCCNFEAFQTCSVLFKETVGVCGTYGKNKKCEYIFVVKSDRKRTLGRFWRKLGVIIKCTIKK